MGAASADAVAGCASAAVPGSSADSYPAVGAPADILADEGAGRAAAAAVVAVADTVAGANVERVVGGLVFAAVSGHARRTTGWCELAMILFDSITSYRHELLSRRVSAARMTCCRNQ